MVVCRSAVSGARLSPNFRVQSDEPGLIHASDEFSAAELLERFPVDTIVGFFVRGRASTTAGKRRPIAAFPSSAPCPNTPKASRTNCRNFPKKKNIRPTFTQHNPRHQSLIIALKNIAPYTDIEILKNISKPSCSASGTARSSPGNFDVEEQNIWSIRAGGIIGTHEVLFGFPTRRCALQTRIPIARSLWQRHSVRHQQPAGASRRGFMPMEDLLLPHLQAERQRRNPSGRQNPGGSSDGYARRHFPLRCPLHTQLAPNLRNATMSESQHTPDTSPSTPPPTPVTAKAPSRSSKVEAVRKRPACTLATRRTAPPVHHLAFEVVDNPIDEALAGPL